MVVKVDPISVGEIESRLFELEQKFDMPTMRFVEAFRNGRLMETELFFEWAMLYEARALATS